MNEFEQLKQLASKMHVNAKDLEDVTNLMSSIAAKAKQHVPEEQHKDFEERINKVKKDLDGIKNFK